MAQDTRTPDGRFYVEATSVYERTYLSDFAQRHRLVQSFTTKENAEFYAQVLNRRWKEGKIQ